MNTALAGANAPGPTSLPHRPGSNSSIGLPSGSSTRSVNPQRRFDLIADDEDLTSERLDPRSKVSHLQHDPIPSPGRRACPSGIA